MNESKLYRIALSAAVLGLVMALASFAFPKAPAGVLSFYFTICWSLWIACAVVRHRQSLWYLLGIWVSIDVAILVMFLSIDYSLGNINGAPGTDLVWAICYAPMLVPSGFLASSLFQHPFFTIDPSIISADSSFYVIFTTWIDFSILASSQAIIITYLARYIRTLWSKRKHQFQM